MKQFQRMSSDLPTEAGHYWMKQGGYLFVEEIQIVDAEPCKLFEGVWRPIKRDSAVVPRLWGQAPIPRPESGKEK